MTLKSDLSNHYVPTRADLMRKRDSACTYQPKSLGKDMVVGVPEEMLPEPSSRLLELDCWVMNSSRCEYTSMMRRVAPAP